MIPIPPSRPIIPGNGPDVPSHPDFALTFLLLLPLLALGVAAVAMACRRRPPRSRPRRLSGEELRRLYRINAARAGQYQNN